MFTENNYVYTPGKKYGDEYVKTPIGELTNKTDVISLKLPLGGTSFATPIKNIEVVEYEEDAAPITVYDCVFENSMGNRYTVQLEPSDIEVFCKYSEFKNLGLLLQWSANFCTLDWRGIPAKLISATPVEYTGRRFYKITTKETPSILIGGITFGSRNESTGLDINDIR